MTTSFNSFNFDKQLEQRLDRFSQADDLPEFQPKRSASVPFMDLNEKQPAVVDHSAFLENPIHDVAGTASHKIECEAGDIWIQGNTLLCACPDCRAPISIRGWLRLADCWRCQSSISLTDEQLDAIDLLSRVPEQAATPQLPVAPLEPQTFPQEHSREVKDDPFKILTSPESEISDPRQRELEQLTRGSVAARIIRRGLNLTPAWMVSFMLHIIGILILALIVWQDSSYVSETITLSTYLSAQEERGGQIRMENPLDALQDDLALRSKLEKSEKEIRNVLAKAQQDADELVTDNSPRAPLPDINQLRQNLTTRPGQLMSFASRDPRVRAEIVRREGGTTITEAAVARGLRWLASVQNKDGSWSLKNYAKHKRANNEGDVMGTSLALLPMLGAGQTHEFGKYKQTVDAGLAWLIENQEPNGDLRAGYTGQAGMYAHGQAAIVLCEALALTGDERFREPAQLAIRFIEAAQHGGGGWRYKPGQPGDTSVFGWQMMALQSARAPQLDIEVDDSTMKLADYFLDQVAAPAKFDNRNRTSLPTGAAYCYQKGRNATPAMTAEAILCRIYLGWKKNDPRLSSAVKWLINDHLPDEDDGNLYYWYYGTQVMHHYGGEPWKIWNSRMRGLLISTQKTRGSNPGSWDPGDFEWGNRGGRIYTTSLACCTLEVYYRHLPIFKQISLDE